MTAAKKIVFQGEPGANSHLASREVYPDYAPVPCAPFEDAFAMTTNGEAELGIFLANVFNARGIELAGPFPADLQQELVFPAAVATDAKEPAAAKALIDFLQTPTAATAIKAVGMTPG